jgi:hypothetical protein
MRFLSGGGGGGGGDDDDDDDDAGNGKNHTLLLQCMRACTHKTHTHTHK